MANTIGPTNPVTLMMPGMAETMVGLSAAERQRKLAELMQQQSMQPIETPPASGGWAVPISPLSVLAKGLQGYSGIKGGQQADAKQLALMKALAGNYSGMFGSQPSAPAQSTAVQGALSAPPQESTDAGGQPMMQGAEPPTPDVGPTNTRAAALASAIQSDPSSATTKRGPLQTPGQDAGTSMIRFGVDPKTYMENLYKSEAPGDKGQLAIEAGMPRGSPGYRSALASIVAKEGHIPLTQMRAGSMGLDQNNNVAAYNPPAIPGSLPTFNGAIGTGYQPAPGGASGIAQESAAKSGGQAWGALPYQPPTTYQTPGAPTAYTPTQAITRATGTPPVAPWGTPAQPPTMAPTLSAQEKQTAQTDFQGGPGIPLQDQAANAAQQSFGRGMGEAGHKIFLDGAASAQALPQLQAMTDMVSTFTPGKLAPLTQSLGQWAVGTGLMTEQQANSTLGNIGNMQALTSAATRLAAVSLRQSDGNPAVKQLELMLDAMPNKGQTPEGFALTMRFMQAAEKMKITKMQEAAAYLKQPGKESDITGFEDYWSRKVPQLQQQIYGAITPPAGSPVQQPQQVPTASGPNGQKLYLRNGQWMPQ